MTAIRNKSLDCDRLLLSFDCEVQCGDTYGITPLHYCCFHLDEIEIVESILNNGADIEALTTINRCTPFMLAIQENNNRTSKYLLSQHPNIDIINGDGECSLHNAIDYNNHEMLRLLLQHQAEYRVTSKYVID